MKTQMNILGICIGIIVTGITIGTVLCLIKGKPTSPAIIGGADGPTSIYLPGRLF